ncbi:hypothetical protein IE53DRAFT_315024, partial [Violaceomyces palustris]
LRKVAKEAGIRRCLAIRKSVLTTKHTEKRLQWAKDNRATDWHHVLFMFSSQMNQV